MCEQGDQVRLWHWNIGGYLVDRCISELVRALNDVGGVRTVASCCGHGHRPGNIALADGRELIIVPDFETGRKVDRLFPLTSYGEPIPTDEGTGTGPSSETMEEWSRWAEEQRANS